MYTRDARTYSFEPNETGHCANVIPGASRVRLNGVRACTDGQPSHIRGLTDEEQGTFVGSTRLKLADVAAVS